MVFLGWEIVGLPDTTVKESKERIKTAIKNSIANLQSRKYVINLSPADIRKEGSLLDLPIATAILMEIGIIVKRELNNVVVIGELSLDGEVKPVKSALTICIEAKKLNFKKVILPKENAKEASLVNGIEIIGVSSISELVYFINNKSDTKYISNNSEIILKEADEFEFDFANIKGQNDAKRGLEIAVAGQHNVIMSGIPGSGKTLLSKSIISILPRLSYEEILEILRIRSITENTYTNVGASLEVTRPFRAPHHSITQMALIGGGKYPKPGEITKANKGILFLDEITEFKDGILEGLREPLEDKEIMISRFNNSVKYPCDFMLVAAMNPCKCGFLGSKNRKCTCSRLEIEKYRRKLSEPFLDRIDIHLELNSISISEFSSDKAETSKEIRKRVIDARELQFNRYKGEKFNVNSLLSQNEIKKYCKINSKSTELLNKMLSNNLITIRTYYKIIKVARTIADLEKCADIKYEHILEAVHYRNIK